MVVQKVSASNFGSYRELEIDFTEGNPATRLILIQGATGSGKSTLCDLIPWVLFGKTSKNGSVDEIRSWNAEGPTKVVAWLGNVVITRTRGSSKDNDLNFFPYDGVITRGKDITDTQRLLNQFLGMDYELYLASAYYHEFSQTAQFFTTTAKNRRTICEQLVDLSLAVKLQDGLKKRFKELAKALISLNDEVSSAETEIKTIQRIQREEVTRATDWEVTKTRRQDHLAILHERFELGRKKVVSNTCRACNTVLAAPKTIIDDSPNPYEDQILALEGETNPHSDVVKDYSADIKSKETLLANLKVGVAAIKDEMFNVEEMETIVESFRGVSIENTIEFLETKTNQLLTDYFDAEIRIEFEVSAADKVEVSIYKDGNTASFTQLSKGQRQLLKLCFGISVMETVQNYHGIDVKQLWFDEATDGLDETMKLKAVRMLGTITHNYNQVFLVEHNEAIKAMIDDKYSVSLVNGGSVIAKT